MKTIWRVQTTVAPLPLGDRKPSEFVDWYEGTEAEARKQFDEDTHRYGLPIERVTTVWTLCDADTLKPVNSCAS